jgi:hypothetical protein
MKRLRRGFGSKREEQEAEETVLFRNVIRMMKSRKT